ncbi:unnamed protein product [Penicillium egyptiacum]|uniref:Uncharacterized protein n=1 Tax=Penicillium egyptiacum TaxID=1303716 RepID=A0A9W4KJA2_9EURO|nr:unnamed protein product [Penicillium egyptiacum]
MADDDGFALYNYDPSVAASVIFALVFATSAAVHIWHAFFKARAWFFTAFIIGSISQYPFHSATYHTRFLLEAC